MSDFVNTIDVVGDKALLNSITDRSITKISDNIVETIGRSAFCSCASLTTVDFPAVTRIDDQAFYKCSSLTSVILRSETMCSLSSVGAFNSSPIVQVNGYIYVPRALVDTYKSATNWSTHAARFRALEDYTVDGTITGALDPNKI